MKRRITFLVIPLSFLCIFVFAFAQTTSHSLMSRLNGYWHTEGKAFGHKADIIMEWKPVLEGAFYQISYKITNKLPSQNNLQVFSGIGYYKAIDSTHFEGTWFDSQGAIHPLSASCDDSSLTTLWGKPETQLGKTIYRFVSVDSVEITDFIMKKDSTWREFSRNIVNRMNVFYDTIR